MVEALSLLNCFCRRVTLSDTLKKSIASHVQASHLREGAALSHREKREASGRQHTPREEMGPLNPRDDAQRVEEGSTGIVTSLATWDEIADEVRRHLRMWMQARDKWRH